MKTTNRVPRCLCALLAAGLLTGAACSASGSVGKNDNGGVKVGGKVSGDNK